MRGRRPSGPESVDDLPGSDIAKERLKALLQAISGERRVVEVCDDLGIGLSRYHQLRQAALGAALDALEPRAAGRPSRAATAEEAEIERLRREADEREAELKLARVREEVAAVLRPASPTPPAGGKKNGGSRPPRRRGAAGRGSGNGAKGNGT